MELELGPVQVAQEADAGGSRFLGKGMKKERKKSKGEEMGGRGKREGDRRDFRSTWELGKEDSDPGSAGVLQALALGRTEFFRASAFSLVKPGQRPLPLSCLEISMLTSPTIHACCVLVPFSVDAVGQVRKQEG